MAFIDVFNGDADGICALIQLRSASPCDSQLITGVKRDIALVDQVTCQAGDQITVLDVSFDKNRTGIEKVLSVGANICYFDHHFAGDIIKHNRLEIHINTNSDTCTSLLVNEHLNGKYKGWAAVGAFGDNLKQAAKLVAKSLATSEQNIALLESLGTYINYNGYGSSLDDLHFTPANLYKELLPFHDPISFINESKETFQQLEHGYQQDMSFASSIRPTSKSEKTAIFILPNEPWARRVSGVYSNDLANKSPARAHAVLTEAVNDTYLVSIRAPLNNKTGADEICRQFPTGGGRKAAAGINSLPSQMLGKFIDTFNNFYV